MNMEQQYNRLSSGRSKDGSNKALGVGAAFVGSILVNVARQQIQNQANARIATAIAGRAVQGRRGSGSDGLIRTARAVSSIGRTERRP